MILRAVGQSITTYHNLLKEPVSPILAEPTGRILPGELTFGKSQNCGNLWKSGRTVSSGNYSFGSKSDSGPFQIAFPHFVKGKFQIL